MPWLFPNPSDRAESVARKKTLALIDRWWEQFQTKAADIDALFKQKKKWDLPAWMEKSLQAIDPNIMWEYGPGVKKGGHRLVITPESHKELRPLTATILERAPDLKGWEFYPYRLAESLDMSQQSVAGRTGGSIEDVQVEVRQGEHHRIDLTFRSPRTEDEEDNQALNDAFVATECLLGEEALDKWVGVIEVAALPKRGKKVGLIPLERLKETFDAVIGSIQDRLPAEACWKWYDSAEWSLMQLKPEEAEDYPGRFDLLISGSLNTNLWQAMHSNIAFYSERFSKCGEIFAYVKIDGIEGLEASQFADRAEIEDAIDAALLKKKLGIHFGGGTGLRYSYIDLALTDLQGGVEMIRQVLQKGKIPKRSWLFFFDADLCDEWVGVYDDSPKPPMVEEED